MRATVNTSADAETRLLGARRRAGARRRPAALARPRARARAQQPGTGGRRPVAAARSRRRACRGRAASGEPDHRAHGGAADRGHAAHAHHRSQACRLLDACGSSRPIAYRSSVRRRTSMPRCAARSANAPISSGRGPRSRSATPPLRSRRARRCRICACRRTISATAPAARASFAKAASLAPSSDPRARASAASSVRSSAATSRRGRSG